MHCCTPILVFGLIEIMLLLSTTSVHGRVNRMITKLFKTSSNNFVSTTKHGCHGDHSQLKQLGSASINISSTTYISESEFNGMKTRKGLTIKEDVVFQGYRNIVRRDVQLPNGKIAQFDVLIQKHLSVVVFIWDTKTSTTTLIREYHPGPEEFLYGTVAGMYEFHKHTSPLQSAQYELEEEAQLETKYWYSLVDESQAKIGMSFDKYSNNHFFPYLALDCTPVMNPKAMDDDEYIMVEKNVTHDRLMNLMKTGQMNVVSTFTILLGLQKLAELGIDYRTKN